MNKNKFNNQIDFENFNKNAIVNYSDILNTYDDSQKILAYKYLKARKLRNKGHKIVEISNLVGIPKPTLYGWNSSNSSKGNPYSLNCIKNLKDLGLLPLISRDNDKFRLILKLFAYVLTDGCINKSFSNVYICGELADLKSLGKEIDKFFPNGKFSIISKSTKGNLEGREIKGISHYMQINSRPLGRLLHVLGCPKGDKVKQIMNLQKWIFDLDVELKKIFLGVLWSAEGSKPIKAKRNYHLYFTMAKDVRLLNHHIEFLDQIRHLFEEMNIETTKVKLGTSKTKRKDGILSRNCYFYIKGDCENFIRFYELIPIFSSYKKQKFDEAYSHYVDVYNRKIESKELKQSVLNETKELFKLGYSVNSVSKKLKVPRSTLRYWLGLLK